MFDTKVSTFILFNLHHIAPVQNNNKSPRAPVLISNIDTDIHEDTIVAGDKSFMIRDTGR